MKKRIAVIWLCLIMIPFTLMGCSSANVPEPQTVIVDSSRLDEAVSKLSTSTEQLEKASKNIELAIDSMNTAKEADKDAPVVRATLVLCIDPNGQDFSDRTQSKTALSTGGMLIMKDFKKESVDQVFPEDVYYYGAADEAGYSFTCGDVLNYIASFGWEIKTVKDIGVASYYYFSKAI